MILFGVDLGKLTYPFHVLEKYIRKTWQKGFVDVKPCHDNSFKYLSKYLLKGSNVPDEKNRTSILLLIAMVVLDVVHFPILILLRNFINKPIAVLLSVSSVS